MDFSPNKRTLDFLFFFQIIKVNFFSRGPLPPMLNCSERFWGAIMRANKSNILIRRRQQWKTTTPLEQKTHYFYVITQP